MIERQYAEIEFCNINSYLLQHLKIIIAIFLNYNCNVKEIFFKKVIEQVELVNYIKNVQHEKSTIVTPRINLCNIIKQLLQHHLTSQRY